MCKLKLHQVRMVDGDQILSEAVTECNMALLGYDEDYCPKCGKPVDWESVEVEVVE